MEAEDLLTCDSCTETENKSSRIFSPQTNNNGSPRSNSPGCDVNLTPMNLWVDIGGVEQLGSQKDLEDNWRRGVLHGGLPHDLTQGKTMLTERRPTNG